MQIRKIQQGEDALIFDAASLFDDQPNVEATARFLASETHHIFIAYEDDQPAGFITGIEMTHPDKATEMFIYELGVEERFRRRGIGSSLVASMQELARERGCYGMWVLTDNDNDPALATYRKVTPNEESVQTMLGWNLSADQPAL